MKFDAKIFRSKIAHRIFFLFVSCALFPILCISIIAFIRVTKQLNDQSYRLLKQSVTGYAYSILERLMFLDTELQLIASSSKENVNDPGQTHPIVLDNRSGHHFKGVALYKSESRDIPIHRVNNSYKKLGEDDIRHIFYSGKTAISIEHRPGSLPHILMVGVMDPKVPDSGYFIGEINPGYLWAIDQGNPLPPGVEVCVLDQSKNVVFSSFSHKDAFLKTDDFQVKNSVSGQFEFVYQDEKYLASYRKIFLDRQFLAGGWTVVLSQSKSDALMPMSQFKTIFPLVVLMSLWVVILLSMYSIRKSLVPLELLKKGTHRIAMKNLDYRVNVTSGDEFQELAMDFNKMADQLTRQFKNLNTKADIDRAILSSLDTEIITKTVIHHIYELFDCDCIAISLIDSEDGKTARAFLSYYGQEMELWESPVEFQRHDLEMFRAHPEYLILNSGEHRQYFLSSFFEQEVESFLILPVFLKEKLKAVITLGRSYSDVYSTEDITQARQMTDQVAVALSNANLIEELEKLNWGTLKALARAVDAKSSWTAGHSARVTNMALKIGSVMGFSQTELDNLHRAALLHDIGKLGVPVAILDKPGALDDEEYDMIKRHPSIGARILEPIAPYKDIIPMVLHHHERHDGKGYPHGLSGSEINIGGRILAVADVFDALSSVRPYRDAWPLERVIDLIENEAGGQFDPEVVKAFLEVMNIDKTQAA